MSRIKRFVNNARWGGTLRTLLVVAAMGYLAVRHPKGIPWPLVLGVAAITFVSMYPLRTFFVSNLKLMTWVLSASMVAAVVFAFGAIERNGADFAALPLVFAAFLGAYLGCYFWLLSDPRVGRGDE